MRSFKIVLVGDAQVGKTSLIQRFIANQPPGVSIANRIGLKHSQLDRHAQTLTDRDRQA